MSSLTIGLCGTAEENYKDELIQIIKQMLVENKPLTWRTIEEEIIQHNKDDGDHVLTKNELDGGDFYLLVPAAVWKGVQEGELGLIAR